VLLEVLPILEFLKVLEKYQMLVDIVTGTSMGAVIGGAYASGIIVKEECYARI